MAYKLIDYLMLTKLRVLLMSAARIGIYDMALMIKVNKTYNVTITLYRQILSTNGVL